MMKDGYSERVHVVEMPIPAATYLLSVSSEPLKSLPQLPIWWLSGGETQWM